MNNQTQATEPERILVRDGVKEFNHYLTQFNRFAPKLNAFADKVESELPDLKIKFSKELFLAFNNGWGKNKIAAKIEEFTNTQPHSLRDHVLNWHWEKLNMILEEWELTFKQYQFFLNPVALSYPSEATDIDVLPFNESGRLEITEEFKSSIRDHFNKYIEGGKNIEALAIVQRLADVYNEIAERITAGKSHPQFTHDFLRRIKPVLIESNEAGTSYSPAIHHLNNI